MCVYISNLFSCPVTFLMFSLPQEMIHLFSLLIIINYIKVPQFIYSFSCWEILEGYFVIRSSAVGRFPCNSARASKQQCLCGVCQGAGLKSDNSGR